MNPKLINNFRFTSVVTLVFIAGMPSQPANAEWVGCTSLGDRGTANTCIQVLGDKRKVTQVAGSFFKLTKICNWRYEIAYTDLKGKTYLTEIGNTHTGCDTEGKLRVRYYPSYTARIGEVCARLYQNNKYLDAACVSITP